jgi:hypothetical protein
VTAAEELPTPADLKALVAKYAKQRSERAAAREAAYRQRTWVQRLFRLKPVIIWPEDHFILWSEEHMEAEITDLRRLVAAMQQRQSTPRCLTCGSTQTAPFHFGLYEETPEGSMPTGFMHPGCGGMLQVRKSDFRFFLRRRIHEFSIEGEALPPAQR